MLRGYTHTAVDRQGFVLAQTSLFHTEEEKRAIRVAATRQLWSFVVPLTRERRVAFHQWTIIDRVTQTGVWLPEGETYTPETYYRPVTHTRNTVTHLRLEEFVEQFNRAPEV
jgi:hypothetical protein